MSLVLIIYLAGLTDRVFVASFFIFILCLSIIIAYISYHSINDFKRFNFNKIKKYVILGIIFLSISILVPNRDTIYLMVAANGITDIAKTPEADKARQALNLGLDKIISNLQESK